MSPARTPSEQQLSKGAACPRGHSVMSEDTFDGSTLGEDVLQHVETRGTAECPAVHGTDPTAGMAQPQTALVLRPRNPSMCCHKRFLQKFLQGQVFSTLSVLLTCSHEAGEQFTELRMVSAGVVLLPHHVPFLPNSHKQMLIIELIS